MAMSQESDMDAELAILLRFAERMLAVGIGGLAIYLGYRLFSLVPETRDGEGRITLSKDLSIVMSRVGPGVFFALFGAAAVGLSLREEVAITLTAPAAEERAAVESRFVGAGGPAAAAEDDDRADRRMLLRREIAILNTLPKLLDPALPAHERAHVERAIVRIKLALMKPVWGDPAEGWGTPEDFERWLAAGSDGERPAALTEAIRYFEHPAREETP